MAFVISTQTAVRRSQSSMEACVREHKVAETPDSLGYGDWFNLSLRSVARMRDINRVERVACHRDGSCLVALTQKVAQGSLVEVHNHRVVQKISTVAEGVDGLLDRSHRISTACGSTASAAETGVVDGDLNAIQGHMTALLKTLEASVE